MRVSGHRAQCLVDRWNGLFPPGTPVQCCVDSMLIFSQTDGLAWACRIGDDQWTLKIQLRNWDEPVDLTDVRPFEHPVVDHPDFSSVVDRVRAMISAETMMTISLRVDLVIGVIDQLQLAKLHPMSRDHGRHVSQMVQDTLIEALPEDIAGFMRDLQERPPVHCKPIDWMEDPQDEK